MTLRTQITLNQEATITSTTIATATQWVPVDRFGTPFNVGFGVVPGTTGGSNTFSVQHTFDDIMLASASADGITKFDHSTVSGKSAKIDGNYAFPIAAIRLLVLSASTTDRNITFYVYQTLGS